MEASNLDYTFAMGGECELRCAIDLYGQPLLRYCHNILCDYFEAQDVVQITFIKAYNKRKLTIILNLTHGLQIVYQCHQWG